MRRASRSVTESPLGREGYINYVLYDDNSTHRAGDFRWPRSDKECKAAGGDDNGAAPE